MTYTTTLYDPIYNAFGVPIGFVLADDSIIEIVGLDKSGGVEVASNTVEVPTIKPACIIRMADLLGLELAPEDLIDAVISLNAVSWKIDAYFPKPSPLGERDGELYLILTEAPA